MNKRLPSEGFGGLTMLTFTCHDGLQMRIRFERKNKNRAAAELSLQRDGHPVTELEDKLWRPVVILPFVSLLTDLAKATGQEKLAADFTNWICQLRRRRAPLPALCIR